MLIFYLPNVKLKKKEVKIMAKKLRISLSDANNLEYVLEEDGSKGDIIAINDATTVDLSIVYANIEKINEAQRNIMKAELRQELNSEASAIQESALSKQAADMKEKYNIKITDLEQEKFELSQKITIAQNHFDTELSNNENKINQQYLDKISKLNSQIETIKQQTQLENETVVQGLKNDKFTLSQTNTMNKNNFETRLKDNENKINEKYRDQINDLTSEIKTIKQRTELANDQALQTLKNTNFELTQANKIAQNNFDTKLSNNENRINKEYRDQISKLNSEVQTIRNQEILNSQKALISKEQELKQQYDAVLNQKLTAIKTESETAAEVKYSLLFNQQKADKDAIDKKYNDLTRQRQAMSIKVIGEDLENWIEEEYKRYSFQFDNCPLSKTNKAIKGKKPDFEFVVNNDAGQVITRVIIEAKSESMFSKDSNRKKNSDHLAKLNEDRINFDGQYGLLISELEMNTQDFLVSKVNNPEYKNIFIIRPQYFITFLSLVKEFALKRYDLTKETIDLENKEQIIRDFENFKETLLKDTFNKIKSQVETIQKEADKLQTSVTKIDESAYKILTSIIQERINKISKWKIEKKVPSLKKITN